MALQFGQQLSFEAHLRQGILNPKHKLVRLSKQIDWTEIGGRLRGYYSVKGRRGLPLRLMVGLQILKHMEDMSDRQCADRLSGDLYWMYFCGVEVDELKGRYSHLDATSMTKFRNRIGDRGWAEVEAVIREYLIKEKKINPKEMVTDSSCLEKNVAYPTDSGLLDKGRRNLVKGMKALERLGVRGEVGVRSYVRRSKQIVLTMMKLGKDRAERIQAGTLELARQAVHVLGKSRKIVRRAKRFAKKQVLGWMDQMALKEEISSLKRQQKLVRRVIEQARQRFRGIHIKKKIYSLHEPQVVCISKGKRSKPNEYGSKFNLSIDRNGYIVNHESYSTNKNDAELLEPALKNWEETTAVVPKQVNADRGYVQKQGKLKRGRIKNVSRVCIPTLGKVPHPKRKALWFRKGQAMRAGIEAVIGHLKQDHRMDRCRYAGFRGDKINIILASMAWNLNKLARDTT